MESKIKIAFITYEYPPDNLKGGISTYTYEIANLLSSNAFEVHVFAASKYRNQSETINNVKIHWILCDNPIDFKILVDIQKQSDSELKFFYNKLDADRFLFSFFND